MFNFIQGPEHEDKWQRHRRTLDDRALVLIIICIIIITLIVDHLS
jgi:hypothetical protein